MPAKSDRLPSKGVRKPQTEQRTYRFSSDLIAEFEEECVRHLRNPRLVLEAAIRHWLDADAKQKEAIARRHTEWAGKQGMGE